MLSYFQVREQSMEPAFYEGDFVLVERMSHLFLKPRVGQVVIVKDPRDKEKLLLKRIVQEKGGKYWVKGDNTSKSTDSRHFGWLEKGLFAGKVIHRTGPLDRSIMI
ncbi:MAG: S26 family signal peptidase [bacterium]|nr:S26 family signal peptidase [bacterium]